MTVVEDALKQTSGGLTAYDIKGMNSTNTSEEKSNENGVLFYTNTDGFPISEPVWHRMFAHAGKVSRSDTVSSIRNTVLPPPVPIPKVPLNFPSDMSVHERISLIQQFMRDLQYNHTGTQFFDIKKYRPVYGLMESAKEMIRESLPIKCLEAVVLGIFLTNGIPGLKRFPLSFRTQFKGTTHRHVVLGLSYYGQYGSIGMSRREDLMYKSLEFSSLGELVVDFLESYNQYWHSVKKVKVGYPVTHDPMSCEPIHWKGTTLSPGRSSREEIIGEFEKHVKAVKTWCKSYPTGNYAPKSPGTSGRYVPGEKRNQSVAGDIDRTKLASRSLDKETFKHYLLGGSHDSVKPSPANHKGADEKASTNHNGGDIRSARLSYSLSSGMSGVAVRSGGKDPDSTSDINGEVKGSTTPICGHSSLGTYEIRI